MASSIASCLILFSFSALDFSFSIAFSRDLAISVDFSLLTLCQASVSIEFSGVDFNFSLIFYTSYSVPADISRRTILTSLFN